MIRSSHRALSNLANFIVMRHLASPFVLVTSLALVAACGGADEVAVSPSTSSDRTVSTPDSSTTTNVVSATTATLVPSTILVDEQTDSDMCNSECRQTFLDEGYTEADLSMIDVFDRFNEVVIPTFIDDVLSTDERVGSIEAYGTLFFEDDPLSAYVYINAYLNEGGQQEVVEFTWSQLLAVAPFWIDPAYFGDSEALLRPEISIEVISLSGGLYLRIDATDVEQIARGNLSYEEWFDTFVENY